MVSCPRAVACNEELKDDGLYEGELGGPGVHIETADGSDPQDTCGCGCVCLSLLLLFGVGGNPKMVVFLLVCFQSHQKKVFKHRHPCDHGCPFSVSLADHRWHWFQLGAYFTVAIV